MSQFQPKLPPLPDDAFDGEKYSVDLPQHDSLPKRCDHKKATLASSTEVHCSCGSGWTGENAAQLHKLLTS